MTTTFFSLFSVILNGIGTALLAVLMPVSSFFGYTQYTQPIAVSLPVPETDSGSLSVASGTVSIEKKIVPVSVIVPKIHATTTPPIVSTSTQSTAIGTTTLAIQSVPLLVGGTVHPGESPPVSYLQITNIGSESALLKGFWVKQSGSAPVESIIGLSTVDDKGGSRGLVGGVEGGTPFQNGLAFAPTDTFFAPGQMRLFTIKAIMTHAVSPYIGMQLVLVVTSIETTAAVKGQFPISGTTWTIAQ